MWHMWPPPHCPYCGKLKGPCKLWCVTNKYSLLIRCWEVWHSTTRGVRPGGPDISQAEIDRIRSLPVPHTPAETYLKLTLHGTTSPQVPVPGHTLPQIDGYEPEESGTCGGPTPPVANDKGRRNPWKFQEAVWRAWRAEATRKEAEHDRRWYGYQPQVTSEWNHPYSGWERKCWSARWHWNGCRWACEPYYASSGSWTPLHL